MPRQLFGDAGSRTDSEEVSDDMQRFDRRVVLVGAGASALGLVLGGRSAEAQRGNQMIFTTSRPPRDFVGDIRGWASARRATAYQEDTANHVWRVNFFLFMARPPNAVSLTLSWFRVEARVSRYLTNENINVGDPTQRILFHSTTVRRQAGEFDPMEQYEAQVTINDSRGARELGRARIRLEGPVERRGNGVVDFTGAAPVTR
jgi:hypothetical protein